MHRETDYHVDAVIYNEMMASQARLVLSIVKNRKIRNWCENAIDRYETHAERQRKDLRNLSASDKKAKQVEKPTEVVSDGLEVTTPTPEPELESLGTTESDVETTSPVPTEPSGNPPLSDGCSPFHDPTNPNCEFSPKAKEESNG